FFFFSSIAVQTSGSGISNLLAMATTFTGSGNLYWAEVKDYKEEFMHVMKMMIIMANIPLNDPNVDAPAIVPAPVNPDHAPAQPVGLGNVFAPYWIRDNIPNNKNGWIEEDAEEEEEDPEEEPEDDDDMEMDDEAEVIDPYMDDGSNNPPPLNSKDEETPSTSPVIPDADCHPIPPIASFGQNFHFGESSSTANLLTGNSKIILTSPVCPNLGTVWKGLGKMEKFMSERIDTEGRIKKKFKEQDRHFLGLGCDNIETDMTVRNVMSDFSGVKKDVAIANVAIATSGIDDDDDDTAPWTHSPMSRVDPNATHSSLVSS
nr:hypothetical protein [Tanacetum cinerariifolium]